MHGVRKSHRSVMNAWIKTVTEGKYGECME